MTYLNPKNIFSVSVLLWAIWSYMTVIFSAKCFGYFTLSINLSFSVFYVSSELDCLDKGVGLKVT